MSVTTMGTRVGWFMLAGSLALLSYAGNLAVDDGNESKNELLYEWSTAIGGAIQYALVAGIVILLSRRLAPATLGLVRPGSWPRAFGTMAIALIAVLVIGAALNVFLEAGEEQGLVPDEWDSTRAAPFVANFVVVAVFAPVVEELMFRGLGFAVLRDMYGTTAAMIGSGLAFGLAHGLFIALPILTIFGIILAWVRVRTTSIYPAIGLHATFNALALIVAVAGGESL